MKKVPSTSWKERHDEEHSTLEDWLHNALQSHVNRLSMNLHSLDCEWHESLPVP